jgi:hypothetical protein
MFLVKSPLDISAADEDRDHIEQAAWRLEVRKIDFWNVLLVT